ncbi:MAG TPA: class I SAM-dependent methyltransferase [Saprospiraceae bacterium]|jgi:DNA modification methylase|nr:class I SAM-dependent methyltransferase [Saprospiraceae bacterium]
MMNKDIQPPFCQTDVSGSASVDLFGNPIIKDELLRDKFIEPPFSVLDSKSGNWNKRRNKWKALGIKSELGRLDAKTKNGNYNRLIKNAGHKGHTHTDTSIFDPALAELIYHWFCPEGGLILDPFAGGSVRGIVANYLGFKYTGIDIRQEQIESNREQALNILPVNNQPQWYVGDSNEVLDIKFNHKFDLIFSCPPYADLEVYSTLKGDISNMNYQDFLVAYKSIIVKAVAHLKKGGFACFVVGEVRDKKGNYIGFVPDTIKAMEDAGLKYYNECIYLNGLAGACLTAGRIMGISKKVKKVHQNVIIFRKV